MREKDILTILEKNQYVDLETLARSIGVSSRTIRNDLKELQIGNNSFLIEKSKKTGYSLTILNVQAYQEYLASLEMNNVEMQEERVGTLLILILVTTEFQTIQQLSQELLVSTSQIKKDLTKLEKILQATQLKLERKAHYGIRITGSRNDRFLLLLEKQQQGNQKLKKIMKAFLTEEEKQALTFGLISVIKKRYWKISYVELNRLKEELYLLLLVMSESKPVAQEVSTTYIVDDILMVAQLSYRLTVEGKEYFERSILGKTKNLIIRTNRDELKEKIASFFQQLDQQEQTTFSKSTEFLDLIYLHVASLIERSREEIDLTNPYVLEISQNYPMIFNYGLRFSKWLEQTYHLKINQAEVGFLAMHMVIPYEKQKQIVKERLLRIGVVCGMGGGLAYFIELKLKRIFPKATIQTYSLLEIDELPIFSPDLVFSMLELPSDFMCPVILINEIQENLDYLENGRYFEVVSGDRDLFLFSETFFSLFDETFFFVLNNPKQPYQEILKMMARSLEETVAYRGYQESVMERESFLPTVYQHGVAIPHPIRMQGSSDKIAVCILPEGIQTTEKQVKLIFMISLKENQVELHKLIAKELSELMKNPYSVNVLATSRNYQEFFYQLKKISGRRKNNE